MKTLYEKNGLSITTHSTKNLRDKNNIKRYGVMIVTQKMSPQELRVRFVNGETYHKQETELSINFGYHSIVFTRYR
jgi:hypothetical protein